MKRVGSEESMEVKRVGVGGEGKRIGSEEGRKVKRAGK